MPLFNPTEWSRKIRDPFWYMDIPKCIEEMTALKSRDENEAQKLKDQIYSFFEEQLKQGNVALGTTSKKWNEARKPIDTIVIHHTHNPEGLSKERLTAIELIRLYAPAYAKMVAEKNKKEPIYSDHIRNGKQVFYPYHWMIRSDGTAEQLLFDSEIGWQAGNWDINCRSIAICIDDNHEDSVPDSQELHVIAKLIREKYSHVSKDRIFGHREINPKTTCPSNFFLDTPDKEGWKRKLLEMI